MRNKFAVELPSECLPNINDLRQIFDDAAPQSTAAKRSSHTERTLLQQQQQQQQQQQPQQQQNCNFFDAKPSHVEENIFESKSRNLEFERAKQKFDNPSHLRHQHHHHQREQRERSSGRILASNGGNQQHSSNRANLALPLKSTTATACSFGTTNSNSASNSNVNVKSNLSKDDINRQLFDDQSHSSTVGGGTVGGGNVDVNSQFHKKESHSGSFSRNSINLDGLKISDDETP